MEKLRKFKTSVRNAEKAAGGAQLDLRRQFNAMLREYRQQPLRAGGGNTQVYYFISDIEGSTDFLDRCLGLIYKLDQPNKTLGQDDAQRLVEYALPGQKGLIVVLGDCWDRGTQEEERQIFKTLEALETKGHVLIAGNRDVNKVRFLKELHLEYPYWDKTWMLEALLSKTFDIQQGQVAEGKYKSIEELQQLTTAAYVPYLKKAVIYHDHGTEDAKTSTNGNKIRFSHGCPCNDYTEQSDNQAFRQNVEMITDPPGDIDTTVYYSDDSYNEESLASRIRCIADIGGPCSQASVEHSKKAWTGLRREIQGINYKDDTDMYITRENKKDPPHSWKPTMGMTGGDDVISNTNYPLKAVMGHTPVGYFPLVRNHVLMNDVSASFVWYHNKRTSFPMVKLEVSEEGTWIVTVKCKVDLTPYGDYEDKESRAVPVEKLRLRELFPFTDDNTDVKYTIDETIMLEDPTIRKQLLNSLKIDVILDNKIQKIGEADSEKLRKDLAVLEAEKQLLKDLLKEETLLRDDNLKHYYVEMVGKLVDDESSTSRYLYRQNLPPFEYAYHVVVKNEG
jgi:hypothetical protein